MSPHTDAGELLPCPFCGRPAEYICDGDHHGEYFQLGCPDDECSAHWAYYTEPMEKAADCIKRWNTRQAASQGREGGERSEVRTNEPVAWRWRVKDSPFRTHEWCLSPHCPAEFNRWDIEWEPLFATAAQAQQLPDLAHPERLKALSDAADYVEKIGARYHSGRDIANGIRCLGPQPSSVPSAHREAGK